MDPQKSTRRIQLVGRQLRCDMMGAVRGSRLSAPWLSPSDVCTFSGLSATTGFHRRSEELGAGGPPTASLLSDGSYSLRIAGCWETEDRPVRCCSCPCVHVSTCGYCSLGSGR